jgi:hypothetical protein
LLSGNGLNLRFQTLCGICVGLSGEERFLAASSSLVCSSCQNQIAISDLSLDAAHGKPISLVTPIRSFSHLSREVIRTVFTVGDSNFSFARFSAALSAQGI